ncbi:MAG: hypothetical protein IRZ16_01360 [Myxococcaceae bacterium]|nr:hypothetical protein [Myxococcaceae bacterium]
MIVAPPRILSLVVVVIALVSTRAVAAPGDPPVIEQRQYGSTTRAPVAPRTVSPPSAQAWSAAKQEDDPDASFRTLRVSAELAAATVGAGMLAVGGGLVGCGLSRAAGDPTCASGAIVGIVLGELSGAFAGTVFTGHGLDGNGSLLSTATGLAVGSIVGTTGGLFMVIAASAGNNPIAVAGAVIVLIAAPVLGAVLGYELSSDTHRPRATAWSPFLAPGRHGGALAGISAAF